VPSDRQLSGVGAAAQSHNGKPKNGKIHIPIACEPEPRVTL
jgi:hypothetical protein